jgi:hypothetical protein
MQHVHLRQGIGEAKVVADKQVGTGNWPGIIAQGQTGHLEGGFTN